MRRLISNIEVEPEAENQLTAASNPSWWRLGPVSSRSGAAVAFHTLRIAGEALKIARKKVLLVNSEQEMPSLQFLI